MCSRNIGKGCTVVLTKGVLSVLNYDTVWCLSKCDVWGYGSDEYEYFLQGCGTM